MITECSDGPSGPAKQTPDLKFSAAADYTRPKAIPVHREEDRSDLMIEFVAEPSECRSTQAKTEVAKRYVEITWDKQQIYDNAEKL